VAAKDLHDLVYVVSEIQHLCEQDVSGGLYIHSREEIVSESGVFHGIAGPEVFAGPVERGWRREREGG